MSIDADGLKAAVNGLADDAVATRLLAVCTALVEAEAGDDTPVAILDEAVIRCAGWLRQSNQTLGQMSEIRSHGISAMRASGARALLAPWRPRGGATAGSSRT